MPECLTHQAAETVVQIDPAGVATDGDVADLDLRPLGQAGGYHRDWDQHLGWKCSKLISK